MTRSNWLAAIGGLGIVMGGALVYLVTAPRRTMDRFDQFVARHAAGTPPGGR